MTMAAAFFIDDTSTKLLRRVRVILILIRPSDRRNATVFQHTYSWGTVRIRQALHEPFVPFTFGQNGVGLSSILLPAPTSLTF
jgi:hypothetical protein